LDFYHEKEKIFMVTKLRKELGAGKASSTGSACQYSLLHGLRGGGGYLKKKKTRVGGHRKKGQSVPGKNIEPKQNGKIMRQKI